jgi:DNA-binding MurR/RpiR family transcriptional regulator
MSCHFVTYVTIQLTGSPILTDTDAPMARQNRSAYVSTSPLTWGERINRLPPKKCELIRPLTENPGDFLFLSIRALAQKLGTDTATILRIVRAMGFPGYPEFRRYLHEFTIANVTSLQSMLSGSAGDSDIPAHIRDSLSQDQRNLGGLRNTLDTAQLTTLAKRLWMARRILLIGGDLATCLVSYLEHHLTMLGLPVFSATNPGRIVALLRSVGGKDVVIAISFHRGLRQSVEGLSQAKANGAHCVGITDTSVSPLVRFSDECFFTSVATRHFGDSYVAPIAFCNVVLAACANYRREHTLSLMRQAERDERQGYRWFEDNTAEQSTGTIKSRKPKKLS